MTSLQTGPADPDAAGEAPFSHRTLADFVQDLASTKVAPGSGAAAAVVLALAAGCAAKAFAISERHRPDAALAQAAERALAITRLALDGAQRDGDDFRAWLRSHASEDTEALDQDADLMCHAGRALEYLLAQHRPSVSEVMAPDIAAAEDFLRAFRATEDRNRAGLRTGDGVSS
jgi:hypothetical protein